MVILSGNNEFLFTRLNNKQSHSSVTDAHIFDENVKLSDIKMGLCAVIWLSEINVR